MIKKLRGTLAIAAVILIATGPLITQVWSQAANAQECGAACADALKKLIVDKAKLLFGVDLPLGQESSTFIQNVTQLPKMGFDTLCHI